MKKLFIIVAVILSSSVHADMFDTVNNVTSNTASVVSEQVTVAGSSIKNVAENSWDYVSVAIPSKTLLATQANLAAKEVEVMKKNVEVELLKSELIIMKEQLKQAETLKGAASTIVNIASNQAVELSDKVRSLVRW